MLNLLDFEFGKTSFSVASDGVSSSEGEGEGVFAMTRARKRKVESQRDSFLCAETGVEISVGFNKRLGAGFFGGGGFILQKLSGYGHAFIHAGGTLIKKTLKANEKIRIDTGALVAFEASVDFDVALISGMSNLLFGQEGLFLTTLQGPGDIYMQSLPFSKLVDRIGAVLGDYKK